MSAVKFYRGKQSQYSNERMAEGIYFTTDTHKIMLNGNDYSTDTYTPGVSDTVKTTTTVGALPKGTTAASLRDKTLSQIFDEMLFPTIQPTATPPSASMSLEGYDSLQEVGATAPTESNFNTSFNQGNITCDGISQGPRAGAKLFDVIYRSTQSVTSTDVTFKDPVPSGVTNYYYKVNYDAGTADIKDNKGNTATSLAQLPAGSVTSSAVVVRGVYPIFATITDANISNNTVTKLSLTSNTVITITLASETATSKQKIKIKGSITKIEIKDPFGNWVVQNLTEYPKTIENISVQGNQVEYNVYTRNQGTNGSTQFRITYSA